MDRKEELNKNLGEYGSLLTSTIPTTTIILPSTNDLDATNTDGSSCESLESWTLINDKDQNNFHDDDCENHIEILNKSDTRKDENDEEQEEEEEEEEDIDCGLKDEQDEIDNDLDISSMKLFCDDLSDGISVISDTENEHEESKIRQRYQKTQSRTKFVLLAENYHGGPVSSPTPFSHTLKNATQSLVKYSICITKRGVKCALYVGLGLAILGLLGNFYNYTGFRAYVNPIASLNSLQEKFNKLELENNLIRAEIDLINKQVSYLSKRNEQTKSEKPKEVKTFKAWWGNGDSLKPVDITKEDLKKPFKCPEDSFIGISHRCMMEQTAKLASIMDQLGQPVDIQKEDSESEDESKSKNRNRVKKNSHEWKKEKYARQGSSEMPPNGYKKRKSHKNVDSDENRKVRKRSAEDDSGEWLYDHMKHRERLRKGNEFQEHSGEWHENYMNNRDQLRKQTEPKLKQYKNVKYV